MVMIDLQQLATEKIEENRQNANKNVIFFGAEGHFSAKTAQKTAVFCVSTKLS